MQLRSSKRKVHIELNTVRKERKRESAPNVSKSNKAAVKIQSLYRGFALRKSFFPSLLPLGKRINVLVNVTGNDPHIDGIEKYQATSGKMVFIGTSGLRSLELIARLGLKNRNDIPKLFVIDDSDQVYHFWKALKINFLLHETDANVFERMQVFFDRYKKLCFHSNFTKQEYAAVKQHRIEYLIRLFDLYGYDYLRAVILKMQFIQEDWRQKFVFEEAQSYINHYACENVYVYASNIVSCHDVRDDEGVQSILRNIQTINPKLAIHTDYDHAAHKPKNFYLCEDHIPDVVEKKLFTKELISTVKVNLKPYSNMIAALDKTLKECGSSIDFRKTAFLPSILFRLVGMNTNITDCYFEPSRAADRCVFHLDVSKEIAEKLVYELQKKFHIKASCNIRPFEVDAIDELPVRIGIAGLEQSIFPLIPIWLFREDLSRINNYVAVSEHLNKFEAANTARNLIDLLNDLLLSHSPQSLFSNSVPDEYETLCNDLMMNIGILKKLAGPRKIVSELFNASVPATDDADLNILDELTTVLKNILSWRDLKKTELNITSASKTYSL